MMPSIEPLPFCIEVSSARVGEGEDAPLGVFFFHRGEQVGQQLSFKPGLFSLENIQQIIAAVCFELSCILHREAAKPQPKDMLLYCPKCSTQHIDAPHGTWTNPPHKSHECQACHHVWRQADFPTNGVKEIKTRGERDGDPQPSGAVSSSSTASM